MSARDNADQLRRHYFRLEACTTFEEFKQVQMQFVLELIAMFEKEDDELRAHARKILEEDNGPTSLSE